MKRALSLILALTFLLTLASCGKEEETVPRSQIGGIHTESGDLYPTDFLTFNGTSIEFDEFRYYYLNLRDQYLSSDENYFEKEGAEEALLEETLSVLKTAWGARFLADKYKVKLKSDEKASVKEDIKLTMESYGGKENFLAELEASYMSMDLYEYMMEYSALYLKLFNTLYKDGGKFAWSDKEFYTWFEENYLAVQQIFIPYKSGEDKNSHEKTLEEANEIYQKASDGEDFWQLIEKHGKDDNMLNYTDGYYFTKGQAEDILYESTKALDYNEISKPVAGETGLYILKRMELKKIRMKENRETALFGYTDSLGNFYAGAYDEDFQKRFQKTADDIKVEYGKYWSEINTKTVY